MRSMLSRLLTVALLTWAPSLFGDRDSWLGSTYKVELSWSMLHNAKGDIPLPKTVGTPVHRAT